MDIISCVHLIGGLAFFLFGMSLMGDYLKKLAGGKLEVFLGKLTSTPIKGILLGTFVTAVIQSSSATTVMVVGFVNSGMMQLSQAIGIIMGANIGTTATGWILSLSGIQGTSMLARLLSPTTFIPIIALIGVILYMFSKKQVQNNAGMIMLGFSVLMFGMQTMSEAVEPLKENEEFTNMLVMFSNPLIGILVGTLFTAVIQSSSASVGILQALSMTCGITYSTAIPLILGMNIGACVPVLLSSIGANKDGKRTAWVYLYYNVLGTVLFLAVYYLADYFIGFSFTSHFSNTVGIAVANTIFKVFSTVALLPFIKVLEKLVYLTIRDNPSEKTTKRSENLLDERFIEYPPLAIEQSRKTLSNMAELAKDNIFAAIGLIEDFDPKIAEEIRKNENTIDHYEDSLGTYLVQLSAKELSPAETNEVSKLLHSISDFERIGDHALNICKLAEEIQEKSLVFSTKAQKELRVISNAVREVLSLAVEAFEKDDVTIAAHVEPLEQVVDLLKDELRMRHINRLQNGRCTLELGFVFNDLVANFERIADHCSNVGICVIQLSNASFETHDYLRTLKETKEAHYVDEYHAYKKKYYTPLLEM